MYKYTVIIHYIARGFVINPAITLPPKYKKNKALDNNNCVNGSAEGVNTAPKIVEKIRTYRQTNSIFFAVTIPDTHNIICNIGI